MYFMDDERLREYERFMQHTPTGQGAAASSAFGLWIQSHRRHPMKKEWDKWLLIFHSNPFGCG